LDLSVVKVGGSLARDPKKLGLLCKKLGALSRLHRLVVVAGGGEFADTVRAFDQRFGLSAKTAHQMAVLGMDQYGMLLADLIPGAVLVRSLGEVWVGLSGGLVPVFLPSQFMLGEDPLENSWAVTSDSIALYFGGVLGARRLLLVTDVDGIYTGDPKVCFDAVWLKEVSVGELLAMGRTSVDVMLPKLLLRWSLDCFVVNGFFPDRVEAVLEGRDSVYTLIRRLF
jgi:aspartokinase-like uncharacterized kinase